MCRVCLQEKVVTDFVKEKRNTDGWSFRCKACMRQWAKAYRVTVGDAYNRRRREKHAARPTQVMLWNAKARAAKHGLPFDLTEKDISIPEICPALGVPLIVGDGAVGPYSPSLDKIKPELGYVRGNVVVVSHLANRIKSNANPEQLRAVADFYSTIGERKALLSN